MSRLLLSLVFGSLLVAIGCAQTPAPTPYPTYTPYPTATAVPTYTPYPTYTPLPTPMLKPTIPEFRAALVGIVTVEDCTSTYLRRKQIEAYDKLPNRSQERPWDLVRKVDAEKPPQYRYFGEWLELSRHYLPYLQVVQSYLGLEAFENYVADRFWREGIVYSFYESQKTEVEAEIEARQAMELLRQQGNLRRARAIYDADLYEGAAAAWAIAGSPKVASIGTLKSRRAGFREAVIAIMDGERWPESLREIPWVEPKTARVQRLMEITGLPASPALVEILGLCIVVKHGETP